jgi:pyruvate carboxylase
MIKDTEALKSIILHPKAVPSALGSIGAPMPGEIIVLNVKEGQIVKKGETIAVLRIVLKQDQLSISFLIISLKVNFC